MDFAYESISAFSTRRDNQEAVFGAEEGVKDIRYVTGQSYQFVLWYLCTISSGDTTDCNIFEIIQTTAAFEEIRTPNYFDLRVSVVSAQPLISVFLFLCM